VTLIDLSHPISSGMPIWPGDPEVVLGAATTVATHGYNVASLHLGTQTGTHVDAPFHVDDALPTLDQLPLERFRGPAVVADLRGQDGPIRPEDLDDLELRPGAVVLLCTGWSRHWGSAAYADHPWLDPSAARLLLGSGIRTVAIDGPSVDAPGSTDLPTHHVLARAGVVIAENLTNLDQVPSGATVWLLPLPVVGTDGAPVRAVAVI
jgi:kynurenine formamidase